MSWDTGLEEGAFGGKCGDSTWESASLRGGGGERQRGGMTVVVETVRKDNRSVEGEWGRHSDPVAAA